MNMKTVGGESSGQSGMDEFNRLTVNILNDLYETFPHYALVKTDAYYENVDDEAASCMEGTMAFLQKENFISIDGEGADGRLYLAVQLTSKGLAVLDKPLDSLENSPTLVDKFKSAIKAGSKLAFKEAAKSLVSEATKIYLQG